MGQSIQSTHLEKDYSKLLIRMAKFLIVFATFLATAIVIQARPQTFSAENLQRAEASFNKADRDGTGTITKQQFRNLLKDLKPGGKTKFINEQVNVAFNALDTNGDKKLDLLEYKAPSICRVFNCWWGGK